MTPLQMATVAQTVANGGVRMEPRLVEKVVDPDGRTIDEPLPEEAERVMSEENANALAGMMQNVVEQGTGTAAQLEGVDVSGKTGTAEVGDGTDDLVVHRLHRPFRGVRDAGAPDGRHRGRERGPDRRRGPEGAGGVDAAHRARHDGRRPLPDREEARLRRDGRRLLRRGPAARAPRRAEGAAPALRRGRAVRRALPARGVERRRAARIPTWWRSSTAASGTAPTTSRWSSSRAAR